MGNLGPFTGYGRRSARGPHGGTSPGAHRLAELIAQRVGDAPRKQDCPGHVAGVDSIGRWPIGDCGPDCLLRRYRLGLAIWKNGQWI